MRVVSEAEARVFSELPGVEKRALELFAQDPKSARAFLTAYSSDFARATTQRYWELGDTLWTLFTYDFALTPEDIEKLK